MTIGKPLCKTTALILTLLFLPCSLISCQKQSIDIPFELLEEEDVLSDPLTAYHIVIPSSCSSELFFAAKTLGEKLTEQTGVSSEVFYDTEPMVSSESTVEILLGRCERGDAKRMLSSLRRDDYLCQVKGNITVLGGNSESATFAALDRFYEELFAYVTAYSFLPSSGGFIHRADYPISSITLNGFELFDYTIVYDHDATEKELALAKYLQETLCSEGGYVLDVRSTAEFQGDHKKLYLTIDPEESETAFRVLPHEQGITLSAHDLFGLSVAVTSWSERLLSAPENQKISVSVREQELCPYSHTLRTVASIWIDPENREGNDVIALGNVIKKNLPDLVLAEQLSKEHRAALTKHLSSSYTAKEEQGIFQRSSVCQFLSELDQEMGCSAKLYRVGEGAEAFLLLSLDRFPTKELPKSLQSRTLPLLIVVHTDANGLSDQAFRFSDQRLSLEKFEIDQIDEAYRAFAIYAETNCFEKIEEEREGGYRALALRRLSAFYPHPS